MKKPQAFTLIEISLVLLLIAVIAVGVLSATSLTTTAKLTSARSLTSKSAVTEIDGLVAWYETSLSDSFNTSESYNNKQITTWYDISPSSLVMKKNSLSKTASSAVTYTSNGIGGIPSLTFNGTGSNSVSDPNGKISLSSFYQGSFAQNTIFIVCRPTAMPSSFTRIFIDSASGASVSASGIYATNSVHFNLGSVSNTATVTNPANFVLGQDYILALYFNNTSSKAYVNNTKQTAGNANVSPGSNGLSGLTIGSDRNGNYGFNGLISEIIIYNRTLKDAERAVIFRYLSAKYKIPVLGF